jgi:DivIVA domain-containing protein
MTVLEYLLGMILVGGILFLLVSFVFGRGEALAPMPADAVPVELPEDRPAGAADIQRLRLPVGLRGYRMYEVDWVLDRLAGELDRRDAEIARLRAELAAGGHGGHGERSAAAGASQPGGGDGARDAGPTGRRDEEDRTGRRDEDGTGRRDEDGTGRRDEDGTGPAEERAGRAEGGAGQRDGDREQEPPIWAGRPE